MTKRKRSINDTGLAIEFLLAYGEFLQLDKKITEETKHNQNKVEEIMKARRRRLSNLLEEKSESEAGIEKKQNFGKG